MNNQLTTYYFMVKHKEISAIANTIKQLHIQKDMHMIYKQELYKNKPKEIYYLFVECLVPIMEYIDHTELIEWRKQNLDSATYEENIYKYVKLPSIKKKIDRNDKT